MPSARLQMQLSESPHFQSRLKGLLCNVAKTLLAEDPGTPERRAFARTVQTNAGTYAANFAAAMAMSPNVLVRDTAWSEEAGSLITTATDAELESQLFSYVDNFAGIEPA